jgi:hypothetical protein
VWRYFVIYRFSTKKTTTKHIAKIKKKIELKLYLSSLFGYSEFLANIEMSWKNNKLHNYIRNVRNQLIDK